MVDAKHYDGRIEVRDVGGWLHRDDRLFVAGRDRTRLVDGVRAQVAAVVTALGDDTVPVHGVLCFVGVEWALFARPFEIAGMVVTWPRAAVKLIGSPGAAVPDGISQLAARLGAALPPAA